MLKQVLARKIEIAVAAVLIVATFIFYPGLAYADTLDQQQNTGAINAGWGDVGSGRDYRCQGFKMATYNQITAVSFWPNGKDGNAAIGYRVWIDTANANSEPANGVGGIGGSTLVTNATLNTSALTKYTLSSTVNVTVGNQYVVCFAPWNTTLNVYASSYQDWRSSVSNPYANGRSVNLDTLYASPNAPDSGNMDIQFEIYGQTASGGAVQSDNDFAIYES